MMAAAARESAVEAWRGILSTTLGTDHSSASGLTLPLYYFLHTIVVLRSVL
jgi:hypothetical protein